MEFNFIDIKVSDNKASHHLGEEQIIPDGFSEVKCVCVRLCVVRSHATAEEQRQGEREEEWWTSGRLQERQRQVNIS